MPRSGEDARLRLQQAALDLYRERGYDATTTAQIAERAGLTERTFFRHFADKREVLFGGEAELTMLLARGVEQATADLPALDVVHSAIRLAVPLLEGNRALSEPRQRVIAATPALRERALAKEASLVCTLSEALQRRGVEAGRAGLAAQVGFAAFSRATADWFADPLRSLDDQLDESFADLRSLTGAAR